MKKKPQDKVNFKIVRINTEQFAILQEPLKEKERKVKTELKFGVDQAKRVVGVFARFSFTQEQKVFMIIEVSCHFELDQTSWQSWKSVTRFIIPQNFMRHLAIITIGCARGVLHAKTENTSCAGTILPTVNLHAMIKADLSFDVE